MDIRALLKRWGAMTLEDDAGDPLETDWNGPLEPADLEAWERELGVPLPAEFREFMLLTGGGDFFGLDLESPDTAWLYEEERLLTFHNWGNGDFDCVVVDDAAGGTPGSVVFINHTPTVAVPVAESLTAWLQAVVDEIAKRKTLRHPADYRDGGPPGLYAQVLEALRGVDCELNR